MNLWTISKILSRQFILKALGGQPTSLSDGMRWRGLMNTRYISLAEKIPVFQEYAKNIRKGNFDVLSEEYAPVLKTVDNDPFSLMLAVCIIWEDQHTNGHNAFKMLIRRVTKFENEKLNKPKAYEPIVFEYIWAMISFLHKQRITPFRGEVKRIVAEYKKGGETNMPACWVRLNEAAGVELEPEEEKLYKEDVVFQTFWRRAL